MSKSFKKVVACLLAVLMVMFSVPMTALAAADTTVYTPDVQLQFGAFANLDGNIGDPTWISNFADGKQYIKKRGAAYDLSVAGLSSVQLAPTATLDRTNAIYKVSGLTVEAADTANLVAAYGNDWWGADALESDYALKAGDAFTVTIRMDGVQTISFATTEISYSDNIAPLYYEKGGSGNNAYYNIGTEAQGVSGSEILEGSTSDDLYADDNGTVTCDGSAIITDYDGENYMYAAVGTAGKTLDWSAVTNEEAPDLVNEDGTLGNTYAGKSVMATFCFVLTEDISADSPIQFWVHNGGTDAHKKNNSGVSVFSDFAEGDYSPTSDNDSKSTQTTYALNKFESAQNQFDGTENFGSKKMTFMGVNQNVQSAECSHEHTTTTRENEVPATCTEAGSYVEVVTCDDCGEEISRETKTIEALGHNYEAVVTAPTCTEAGYTTYTCTRCGDTYTEAGDPATGHAWGAWTEVNPAVPATCTEAGTTAFEQRVCANDATHTETRGGETIEALGHNYEAVVTPATCTEAGYTTYTCTRCGDSYTEPGDAATGHDWVATVDWDTLDTETGAVTINYACSNDASHTDSKDVTASMEVIQNQSEEDPEITRFTVVDGEFTDSKDVQTKAAAGHTTHVAGTPVRENEVAATCSAEGSYDEVVYCTVCGEEMSRETKTIDKIAHTPGEAVRENEVAATCAATGSYDEVVYCSVCGEELSRETKTIDKIAHTPGEAVRENEVPATCTATGSYDEVVYCSVCGEELSRETKTIDKIAHTPGEAVIENEVAATKTTDGSYDTVVYCTVCGTELSRETTVVPATGIIVTVPKYDVGTITINGKELDGTKKNETAVAYGKEYTLTVTDGTDYFKGWEMNGKIVSEATSFTSTAYADITVTPVFEVPSTANMTVTFYDKYGNKVKEYKDLTAEQYQAAITTDGVPTAQSYPSQKFVSWDTSDDEIKSLTESRTIYAIYEKVESEKKFTVTVKNAAGVEITDALTLPAGVTNGSIPYDTKVTVSNDAAKGWKIGDTVVSTTDTYEFYIGADTTITMITDDVEAVPTVTIVGANRLAEPAYRYNIVATRNVPDGYTLVDYGFVYGKNLTDAELVLENEGNTGSQDNAGAVKVVRAATKSSDSNQFALNYGIKTAGNFVTVKAFIVVKNAAGTQVIYSDMQSFES